MDIGLVHPQLVFPRGAEKQICELAFHLNEMGNDITLYVFEEDKENFPLKNLLENINVVSLDKSWHIETDNLIKSSVNIPRWYKMTKELSEKLDNHEVLNLHNTPANWISKFTDIPSVWTCNEPAYLNASNVKLASLLKPYRVLDNRLTQAELICVLDERMKGIVGNMYNNDIEIIGSGSGLLRPIEHVDDDFINIICVGPIIHQRRVFDIVKACSIVNNPKIKIHFVGKIMDENLYKEMTDFINSKCNFEVIFHGFTSDDELYEIWDIADLAIMASETQPWGIFPLEAILGNIPTITSSQIGINEFIDNDEFIYEMGNVNELASKIEEIISNYDYFKEKTLKLSKVVDENYSWKGYSKRVYNILKEVSKK